MHNKPPIKNEIIINISYDPQYEKDIHDWILRQLFLKKTNFKSNEGKAGKKGNGLKK